MIRSGPLTPRLLEVVDGQLPVFESGSGGPLLVFIHGWTLDHRVWRPQHAGLSGSARIISFDRRGFGKSTAPAGLSREPGDIGLILDAAGGQRAWLIGQSQGCRVAAAFACSNPDQVAGLILQGAPPLLAGSNDAAAEIPYAALRSLAARQDLERLRGDWLAHSLMQSPLPNVRTELERMVAGYDGKDLLAADAGLEFSRDIITALECPILWVTGAAEITARRTSARDIVRSAADGHLCELPDAGHFCNLEQPVAFNEAIRNFVKDHS